MNTIPTLVTLSADLHEALQTYLSAHPTWDTDRVFTAALSLFLLQDSSDTPTKVVARIYLKTLFQP